MFIVVHKPDSGEIRRYYTMVACQSLFTNLFEVDTVVHGCGC